MEMTRMCDVAKDIARHNSLMIGIPSKQNVTNMLMNHDLSTDSLSKIQFCPAYRFCRELDRPNRLSILDGNHVQTTTFHDLLQVVKESAIRLVQLIELVNDLEKRWKRDSDSQMRYPESGRYKGSDQQRNESKLNLATTPSSVCALCGVELHLKNSSEGSKKFDIKRKDYYNYDCNMLEAFNNMFLKIAPYKATLSAEKEKRRQEIISKTQSINTDRSGLKSKLLFIRRNSSDKITCPICQVESQRHDNITNVLKHIDSKREHNVGKMLKSTKITQQNSKNTTSNSSQPTISSTQNASILTHEMLCPCSCGLLMKDETKSKISTISLPIEKENLIKKY